MRGQCPGACDLKKKDQGETDLHSNPNTRHWRWRAWDLDDLLNGQAQPANRMTAPGVLGRTDTLMES